MKSSGKFDSTSYSNHEANGMIVESNKSASKRYFRLSASRLVFGMLALVSLLFFTACEDDSSNLQDQGQNIIPERFKIDIPSSLCSTTSLKSATLKSATAKGCAF
jgi:hypothetical protein